MSMDPGTIQQLLVQKLMQGQAQPGMGTSGNTQIQGQASPLGAASNLAQKVMLMKSLQQRLPQQQQPLLPQIGAVMPQQPQAMNAPMPGGTNA